MNDGKEFFVTAETDRKELLVTDVTDSKEFLVTAVTDRKEFFVTVVNSGKEFLVTAVTNRKEFFVIAVTDRKEFLVTAATDRKEFLVTAVTDRKEFFLLTAVTSNLWTFHVISTIFSKYFVFTLDHIKWSLYLINGNFRMSKWTNLMLNWDQMQKIIIYLTMTVIKSKYYWFAPSPRFN